MDIAGTVTFAIAFVLLNGFLATPGLVNILSLMLSLLQHIEDRLKHGSHNVISCWNQECQICLLNVFEKSCLRIFQHYEHGRSLLSGDNIFDYQAAVSHFRHGISHFTYWFKVYAFGWANGDGGTAAGTWVLLPVAQVRFPVGTPHRNVGTDPSCDSPCIECQLNSSLASCRTFSFPRHGNI